MQERGNMTYNLREAHSKLYSLGELSSHLEKDLLLECTTTIQVDVSIERLHRAVKDENGHTRILLGDGYLVSLGLPGEDTVQTSHREAFADGEKQVICDLRYADEENSSMSIEDIIRALGLKIDDQIWRMDVAP
jgi:hypothetical protein